MSAPRRDKTSTTLTFFNIIKAYLGSGLLVIPYGARCGGMWLSLIGIILLALGSNQTLKMLIRSKRHLLEQYPHVTSERITYDAIGYYAYGNTGRRAAIFAQVVTNLGIVVGYAIFVGKTLLSAAEICGINNVTLMDPTVFGIHVSIFLVASFPLLAALALLRSMRKLGPVSLVGTIAVVLAIIAVFYSSAVEISNHGIVHVPAARFDTFPTFFGLLVFGYTIHGVTLSIEEGMEHPEQIESVLNGASWVVVVIYGIFSVLCYAAYGDSVDPSILNNLPQSNTFEKVIKVSTSVLLSMSMLLTVPLFFFSVFRTMEENNGNNATQPSSVLSSPQRINKNSSQADLEESLLPNRGSMGFGAGLLSPPARYVPSPANPLDGVLQQGQRDVNEIENNNDNNNTKVSNTKWWKTSVVRILVVAATLIVAILLGPLFSEVISLVGAFSMSMVAFILPAAFYLKILGNKLSLSEKSIGWVLLIFGCVALVVATVQSLQSIIYYAEYGKEKLCTANHVNRTELWL